MECDVLHSRNVRVRMITLLPDKSRFSGIPATLHACVKCCALHGLLAAERQPLANGSASIVQMSDQPVSISMSRGSSWRTGVRVHAERVYRSFFL